MSSGSIRVGIGGWTYEPWRGGAFYPEGLPQKRELEYAKFNNNLGLRRTFKYFPFGHNNSHHNADKSQSTHCNAGYFFPSFIIIFINSLRTFSCLSYKPS